MPHRAPFAEWRETPLGRRARVLFAFREVAERHKDDLARVVSAEHGKVLADALGEVARGLEVVEFACGIPHLLKGGYSEQVSTDTDVHSIRQPLGVCAGHHAVQLPGDGAHVDVADGDRVRQHLRAQADRARPVGVDARRRDGSPRPVSRRACSTSLHGDKEAVDRLLTHPDVRAVSFVGSTPIARHVYETAAAATASGSRRSVARRTTWSCSPTPTSRSPPTRR